MTALASVSSTEQLSSADEFFAEYENRRFELVRGVAKEMPMPELEHGHISSLINYFLTDFVRRNRLGRIFGNDSFIKVHDNPDSVYGPDICFISFERLPQGKIPKGISNVIPELVVEVRSPSQRWTELITKVLDYLAAGVGAVMVVRPDREAVAVYRADADEVHFGREDILTLPDILPGFELPLGQVFE